MAAGRSGGISMLSQDTVSQPASGLDNDGFRKTPRDIKKSGKREQHRIKVVHDTKNNSGSRFKGAQRDSIDLFVYHINHSATVGDLRGYLYDNDVNLNDVRIDITSHEDARFKSFRLIAPGSLKEKLLSPDFWSVGICVKVYSESRQKNRTNRHGL